LAARLSFFVQNCWTSSQKMRRLRLLQMGECRVQLMATCFLVAGFCLLL
jgi:hypothetical protein